MQRYEKYKDSGVEWIGEIPEGWVVKRLKYVAGLRSGNNLTSEQIKPSGDYQVYGGNGLRGYYSDFTHDGSFILIGRQGALCGNVHYAKNKFWATDHAVVVTLFGDNELTWLSELLSVMNLNQYSVAAAQPGLSVDAIKTLSIPFPLKSEQTTIANYLDRKTAEIDQLITQKEKLLCLYEEEKTALINQAVTQGINPDVKLKESGIDWLGGIPEHWEISRAKFVSHVFVPQRNKPVLNPDIGLPWLTMEDMSSNRIKKTNLKVSKDASTKAGSKVLKKGSVVASCVGNFGVCAINVVDVIINQQLQAFIPHNNIAPEYLLETVKISKDYFQMIATAATLVYVNQAGFSNMPILIPPFPEQTAIVQYIETQTTRINAKISKTKKIIALQKEYRTALISEVVTGKIKITPEMAS